MTWDAINRCRERHSSAAIVRRLGFSGREGMQPEHQRSFNIPVARWRTGERDREEGKERGRWKKGLRGKIWRERGRKRAGERTDQEDRRNGAERDRETERERDWKTERQRQGDSKKETR